jgi:hypothetical protein
MISPFLKKQAMAAAEPPSEGFAHASRTRASRFFPARLSGVKKAVSLYINVGAIALGTKISRLFFKRESAIALLGKDDRSFGEGRSLLLGNTT